MNEATINKISQILKDKQALYPCGRCGKNEFTMIDGIFEDEVLHTDDFNYEKYVEMTIKKNSLLPLIKIICNHCGHVITYALGVLLKPMPEVEAQAIESEIAVQDSANDQVG